jgi:hypothetical protein
MLRLKQTLGRRVLCARGVKTWHKELDAPLKRVGARIDAALQVAARAVGLIAGLTSRHARAGARCASPEICRMVMAQPCRAGMKCNTSMQGRRLRGRAQHKLRAQPPPHPPAAGDVCKMRRSTLANCPPPPPPPPPHPMQVMLGHTQGSGALDSPGLTRFTAGVELHHLFMLVRAPRALASAQSHRLLPRRCTMTSWTEVWRVKGNHLSHSAADYFYRNNSTRLSHDVRRASSRQAAGAARHLQLRNTRAVCNSCHVCSFRRWLSRILPLSSATCCTRAGCVLPVFLCASVGDSQQRQPDDGGRGSEGDCAARCGDAAAGRLRCCCCCFSSALMTYHCPHCMSLLGAGPPHAPRRAACRQRECRAGIVIQNRCRPGDLTP